LLKLAQREAAMERGIERITWTYDPLQSRNAHFNFSKLGVISDRYYIDYYGVTSSFLHRFGTDRLWVTWMLKSERVRARIERMMKPGAPKDLDQMPHLIRVGESHEPIGADELDGPRVAIEIPTEISTNQQRWREATRKAFTSAIDAGYVVEEFLVNQERQVGTYILKNLVNPV
jgi:predicted GNAT superfamily acetyltransferase